MSLSLVNFFATVVCFQSILRQANFKGAKLLGASFFDADLTGSLTLYSVSILRFCDLGLKSHRHKFRKLINWKFRIFNFMKLEVLVWACACRQSSLN